ncbi:MAG: type II toxin-antitoxin system RelE/ParE family toxin [Bdellovibrio sp.]|nr:type II toxin-antitoxin system RelE/ParE family toxin [Bdellovibrio sp.]
MIVSFANKLAEDLFEARRSKETRTFPAELHRVALRKLAYLHDAGDLNDLKVPPGNRLEALKRDRKGFFSIRINDQWRLIFMWTEGNAHLVSIEDYHD